MKKRMTLIIFIILVFGVFFYLNKDCQCYESVNDDGFKSQKRYEVIFDMMQGKTYEKID